MTEDVSIKKATEATARINDKKFAKEAKAVGKAAYDIGRSVEKVLVRMDRDIEAVHKAIGEFGLKLQIGRDLYAFDDTGYNGWIIDNKLDTVRIGETQQERTACRTISRLLTVGYIEDPEDENGATLKLDLLLCKRVRPTDIIKWAREKQPLLFDDLRAKAAAKEAKSKEDFPEDDIPDLGGDEPASGDDEKEEDDTFSPFKVLSDHLNAAMKLSATINVTKLSDERRVEMLAEVEKMVEYVGNLAKWARKNLKVEKMEVA